MINPLENGWQRRKDLDGRDVDGYITDSGVEFYQTPKGVPPLMSTPCNCMRKAFNYPLREDLPPEARKVVSAVEEEKDIDALGWLRKQK